MVDWGRATKDPYHNLHLDFSHLYQQFKEFHISFLASVRFLVILLILFFCYLYCYYFFVICIVIIFLLFVLLLFFCYLYCYYFFFICIVIIFFLLLIFFASYFIIVYRLSLFINNPLIIIFLPTFLLVLLTYLV